MRCPFCNNEDTKVVDSRLVSEGEQVRRRRECNVCNERYTTYETIELSLPRVVKQNGSSEPFNQEKLQSGMLKSLEKRPVRMEQVTAIINKIIRKLRACGEREIAARKLGEWVMLELYDLDEVAYVRFASVYRRFQDVEEFTKEVAKIEHNNK